MNRGPAELPGDAPLVGDGTDWLDELPTDDDVRRYLAAVVAAAVLDRDRIAGSRTTAADRSPGPE